MQLHLKSFERLRVSFLCLNISKSHNKETRNLPKVFNSTKILSPDEILATCIIVHWLAVCTEYLFKAHFLANKNPFNFEIDRLLYMVLKYILSSKQDYNSTKQFFSDNSLRILFLLFIFNAILTETENKIWEEKFDIRYNL